MVDHILEVEILLELAQGFAQGALQLGRGVRIRAIEREGQRHGLAFAEALFPAFRNDERGHGVRCQEIGRPRLLRRPILPGKSLVGAEFVDQLAAGLGVVVVVQEGRDVRLFRVRERVAKEEGERGRQGEDEHEDSPIAHDVEKLFLRHAGDRTEAGGEIHGGEGDCSRMPV